MEIIADVGAADANSYVDLVDADAYFDGRLNASAWTGETDDDRKSAALITATNRVDMERFKGTRADPDQGLKWPRIAAYDEDGTLIDSEFIPWTLMVAVFELAIFLLTKGTTDTFQPTGLEGFKSIKAPGAEVVLDTDRTADPASDLPLVVRNALRPLLLTEDADASPGRFRIVRA